MKSTDSVSSTKLFSVGLRAGLAVLVGLLVLASAPSESQAKKRVVLFDFIGPGAATFQAQVRRLLKRRATILPGRVYARAQRKLGIRRSNRRNIKRIAARINADGMVGGVVRRLPGRRYRLRVIVRSGKTGRVVASFNITTRRRRLRGKALRETAANLRVGVRRMPPLFREENHEDSSKARRRRRRKRKRVARRNKRRVERDADDDDDDDDARPTRRKRTVTTSKKSKSDEEVPLTDDEKADRLVRGRGLVVAGGLSVTTRTLSFDFTPGTVNPPRGYTGSPVAGAYVTAELYPLGMDPKSKGATRNIGVSFFLDRIIKINSKLLYDDPATMSQMEVDLPTNQMRWGVGAVYRHNFGSKPTSPTVRLSARYNRFTFDIDKAAAPAGVSVDIPNVDYTYYDIGLGFHFPLGAKLAISLDGRFMLMDSTGEIQDMAQFGPADVTGFDFDGGFSYRVKPRLWFRAGVRFTRVGFVFDGTGALATDVASAADEYLGGYTTLQYLF